METLPLPALPADPAPPPTGQRAASEDRGFADAVRAAHADDAKQDRKAKSDDRTADAAEKPRHGHRTGRRHKTHKAHHRDGSGQDATSLPGPLATAVPTTVETKPLGGSTPKAGASPVDANASTTGTAGIAGGKSAAASPGANGKDAGLPAAGAADFAAAFGGADSVDNTDKAGKTAHTDTASKGDVIGTGDGEATADKPAADKPPKDKPGADAAAAPMLPAIAGQAATEPSSAPADDDGTATTITNDSPSHPAARNQAMANSATAAKAAPKGGTGTAGKAASGGNAADPSGNSDTASTTQAADADQAADDKRKAAADDTRKSDAAKDKKAEGAALDGQRNTDGAARPDSTAATDKPPPSQPNGAAAAATATAHQPSDRNAAPDTGQNPAQNATITPASGFLHDLRAQNQLSAPQVQQPPADAAARLPTPPADQVAVQIGRAMQQGQDHLSVELHPAELGRISVDLQLGSDQRVVATIHADHHDTLQLLQRDSHTLHRALQDAGLRTDSGSLSFNLRGDGGGSQQQSFAQFSGSARPIALRVPAAAAEATARLVRPLRFGDSGIDIRV